MNRATVDGADQGTPPPRPLAPGRQAVLIAALVVGVVLLAMQLWLLTIALDLYLSGDNSHVWVLALISGVVFAGGLLALRLLSRRPAIRH